MSTPTLEQTVKESVDKETTVQESQVEVQEPPSEQEESPDEVEDDESDGEEKEEEEDEWDKSNLINAKNLYKALQNPQTAQEVISRLAQQAGLLKTPQDVSQAKDIILDVLSESLGSEFNFLAPKLSVAIKRILEMERNHTRVALQNEAQERAKIQLASEIESTLGKLRRETKGESKALE